MAQGLPTVNIGGLQISRLVCGTNPFFGVSHFSAARDSFLKRYFTDDQILEVLECVSEQGINACVACPSERVRDILNRLEKNTGRKMYYIALPGGATLEKVLADLRFSASIGVDIALVHMMYTDTHRDGRGKILGAEKITRLTRELGMVPGWSTHRADTIVASDRAGYDVETYVQPYNPAGFLCSVETDWVGKIIRNAQKPVICIKPLAAGRLLPPTGLGFVYSSIKSNDVVACGFMSTEEALEDIGIVRDLLQGKESERSMSDSRSKSVLKGKAS